VEPAAAAAPPAEDPRDLEVRALRAALEKVSAERDRLRAAPPAAAKPSNAPEHAGLLSMANKVLFQKFSEANESSKETATLVKELKKCEEALYEAWSRRQAAEERCYQLSSKLEKLEAEREPVRTAEVIPTTPTPTLRSVSKSGLAALLLAMGMFGYAFRQTMERASDAEQVIAQVQAAAPQFHQEALALLEEGRLDEARHQIDYAIALDRRTPSYHRLRGHISASLLDVKAAAAAYQQAVSLDSTDTVSADNWRSASASSAPDAARIRQRANMRSTR
jgi:tetratricopeptide (TPR) repeat protein